LLHVPFSNILRARVERDTFKNVGPGGNLIALGLCLCAFAQQQSEVTFGTTVVVPGGLIGVIYSIPPSSISLPYFELLNPIGVIYTSSLNVPERHFREGFPGVTNRYEWFAIDYRGRFWIEEPGVYQFALTSDDGSKLYIDGSLIIDNDGIHSAQVKTESLRLDGGSHGIRVSYFQGPRDKVALVLSVAPPGEAWRVFSTEEFRPPPNPENWDHPDASDTLEPPVSSPQLRIPSVEGAPGDTVEVPVLIKSEPISRTVAVDWEMIVPAQVLESVVAPELGSAAADAGKVLTCSKQKSYLYGCKLEGGEKPIPDGPIAIFRFKIDTGAESRVVALRVEKAKATGSDRRRSNLSATAGTVTIR
jgi:PA14 domain